MIMVQGPASIAAWLMSVQATCEELGHRFSNWGPDVPDGEARFCHHCNLIETKKVEERNEDF